MDLPSEWAQVHTGVELLKGHVLIGVSGRQQGSSLAKYGEFLIPLLAFSLHLGVQSVGQAAISFF